MRNSSLARSSPAPRALSLELEEEEEDDDDDDAEEAAEGAVPRRSSCGPGPEYGVVPFFVSDTIEVSFFLSRMLLEAEVEGIGVGWASELLRLLLTGFGDGRDALGAETDEALLRAGVGVRCECRADD